MQGKELAAVLVVDDDVIVRALLSIALHRAGFRVELARDGMEAIEMFTAGEFDLVVTDIRMPRMDGCMLARHIRASKKIVPVIGMSSDPQGFAGEFDLLLEKPFDIKLLVESVFEVLEVVESIL